MKILMVCTQSPLPARAGSPLRTWGWIRTASRFAEVGVVTLTRMPEEEQALSLLRQTCPFVAAVAAPRTPLRKARDLVLSGITRTPYLVASAQERQMHEALGRAIETWKPDVVQAECIGAAPYLGYARVRRTPCVYSAHNRESRIAAGPEQGRSLWQTLAVRRMEALERRVAQQVDGVIAVSEEEAAWFRRHARNVHRVPNAIFPDEYSFVPPSSRQCKTVAFIGHLGYPPNRDAARVLAREVFPRIRAALPGVECLIAGRSPSREVRALEGGGVRVVGDVPDAADLWSRAGILVCPLRWGAGSRLKLIEAAAYGIPIVATRFSAEGLCLEEDRDYLRAEEPEALAGKALELLKDSARADELAGHARRAVEAHHNWTAYQEQIAALYEDLTRHHRQE